MCAGLILPDNTLCERQGELARAIGTPWRDLPLKADYPDSAHQKDGCLCPVDFEILASDHGWMLDYTSDSFNVIAVKS